MQFEPHYFPVAKLSVHVAQLLIIFVAWILEIAVFRSSASIDGRAGWYFALVCADPSSSTIFLSSSTRLLVSGKKDRNRSMANPTRSVSSPSRPLSSKP